MTPKELHTRFAEHDKQTTLEAHRRLTAEVERLANRSAGDLDEIEIATIDELLRRANITRSDFCSKLVPFTQAADLRRRIEREDETALVERREILEAECERLKAQRDKLIWRSPEYGQANDELRIVETKLNETGFALSQLKAWRKQLAELERTHPQTKLPARELAATH